MVRAGTPLHWRRRTCDVTDRRSRDQPGRAGCRRGRESALPSAARWPCVSRRSGGGAEAATVSDADDTERTSGDSEERDGSSACARSVGVDLIAVSRASAAALSRTAAVSYTHLTLPTSDLV